ncbi:MAG: hypothetical protein K8U57_24295 [Planctomycetes bacterium]|nr:hypothetical protein [Planctomycetota bacterium]
MTQIESRGRLAATPRADTLNTLSESRISYSPLEQTMRALFGLVGLLVVGVGFAAEDKKAVKLDGTYLLVGVEAGG